MPHLEDEAGERACYRYRTPVLVGPWRRHRDRAIEDAIAAGQAIPDGGGNLHWTVSGEIEKSSCDGGGDSGGIYPSD